MAADLRAFGQLVRTIVPQAGTVAIFDRDAQLVWAPGEAEVASLRALAADLLTGAGGDAPASAMRCAPDAATSYAFVVRDPAGALLGALALAVPGPFKREARLMLEPLEARIAPLLELLAQDLLRSRALATIHQRVEKTMQLEWLHASSLAEADEGGVADPIERLIRALTDSLDADVAIACIPGHQFERCVSGSDSQLAQVEALRLVASGDLARRAKEDGLTLCVNKARTSAGTPAFRFASAPLRRHGAVIGVLAVFAHHARRALGTRDTRLVERSALRLVELVESRVDRATGLPTRAVLEDHVLASAQRRADGQCLVYLDVDQMHALNDLFGFDVGDDVLRRIAGLWPAGEIAEGGLMGRLSGDRFAAVLDGCTLNRGRGWAEAARARVEELILPPGCKGFRLSASFGVSTIEIGERFETALARATTAGRAAKDRGRNRVEVFAATDLSLLQRQDDLHLFRELCMAIEARRFRLLAHAIVPLADPTQPTHYDLLVRLVDSSGALLEPARFMSAARRYQMLPQLDKGVIELALAEIEPYAALLEARGAVCWINISGSTLGQPDIADAIRLQIKRSGISGRMIGFEITENAAIENIEAATRFIQRVRELGCGVALDDFGTGFSSLAYLKSLAAQAIKIDGSFIRDLLSDGRSQALVSAVLEIARQLGLDTVAEYVETAAVAARLKALGVTYGQGHLYGRPAPLREVLDALAAASAGDETRRAIA